MSAEVGGRQRVCPNCGRRYPHSAAFCSFDGGRLEAAEAISEDWAVGAARPVRNGGRLEAAEAISGTTESRTLDAPPPPEADSESGRPAPAPSAAPGDRIAGRFLLKSAVGQGGFGSTFLCFDEKFKRKAVLKLLHARWIAHEATRRRFELEALALSRMAHPNLVQVYDRGELPDGSPWFVMEFAEGRPVAELLEAGPMREEDVVEIGAQLCDALAAAHGIGVIHRDLKPANLMLGTDKNGGMLLKVLDFGIAAVAESAEETAVRELQSRVVGQIIGTMAYMSPEQAGGERVTPASDIYSAGVVLYHLLTGRLPAELPAAATPVAVLKYVLAKPLPITRARPGISRALVAVVERAMQKEPEKRFASAAEMASALRAANSRARPRSRGWLAAAIAVVLFAAGVVGTIAWYQLMPPPMAAQPTVPAAPEGMTNIHASPRATAPTAVPNAAPTTTPSPAAPAMNPRPPEPAAAPKATAALTPSRKPKPTRHRVRHIPARKKPAAKPKSTEALPPLP